MSSKNSAIVIGAGFGGMAAALRLKNLGYDVTVYDNNPMPGGRAQVYRKNGYKFDAGPTVITAPFLFDELFKLFRLNKDDFIKFKRVEPWYKFVFEDSSSFNYGGTLEDTKREIAQISSDDASGYEQLVKISEKIFNVGFVELADKPVDRFVDMLYLMPKFLKLKSYLTVHQLVSKYIKNEKIRRAFCVHPLLVGGNPYNTTSIYCLIHYLERKWKVWFPEGGTGELVNALYKLSRDRGITYKLNCNVKKINILDKKATGIELDSGKIINSDLIVCDGDAPYIYRNLIEEKHRRKWTNKRLSKLKYSMGLFVWYFGTKIPYPNVEHHTIIFGKTFKNLLNKIFNKKELSEDLSLYLHRPSATDKTMAPNGKDAFYVLAPVPNSDSDIDWNEVGDKVRDLVLKRLESTIMPDLRKNIDVSFYVTPNDFKKNFCTLMGSGFSLSPIFSQSAWFRFHNKSEDVGNLYLCGAGTHPGAGVPGVLSSAKIVEKLIPPASNFDYRIFKETFRKKSKLFSLASSFLPAQQRRHITILYYICRKLDDLTDNNVDKFHLAFHAWRNQESHEILNLYKYLIVHCNLRYEDLSDMLDSMHSETSPDSFNIKDEKELIKYCYDVAGTVGNMFCNVISLNNESALKHAQDLGIAMQLTNIARDFHEDLFRGFKYIPDSYFKDYNLSFLKNNINNKNVRDDIVSAKLHILNLAEDYYRSGFKGLYYLPYRYRFVVRWAALMYREIGRKILHKPEDFHNTISTISMFKKVSLLCKFTSN